MNLTQDEKDLLIRVFSVYYEKCIWSTMAKNNSVKASDEDYKVRNLTRKMDIKDMFPDEIKCGF